jgi:hypothetical protein
VEFDVPNRAGATVQVCGRAANARDVESSYELSVISRWKIGGAGNVGDMDVPSKPAFGLTTTGHGSLELSGVGFDSLLNTQTVSAGTLTLFFEDEIEGCDTVVFQAAVASDTNLVPLVTGLALGTVLECGRELIVVVDATPDGGGYIVRRAAFGSAAVAHEAGASGKLLKRKTVIVPFVRGLFGSPAASAYHFQIPLRNVRVAAAEMFATNSRGNGQTRAFSFTHLEAGGLRTLSGGQYTLQVSGPLAMQNGATPPLRMDGDYAVRHIQAVLGSPAAGGTVRVRLNRNGCAYCEMAVEAGGSQSDLARGLPALRDGDELTLDVVSVPQGGGTHPGRDLTVTVLV